MTTLTCMNCGTQYETFNCWAKRPGNKFCSRSCADAGKHRKPRTWLTYSCVHCGKSKTIRKGYAGKKLYCSKECADKGKRTDNYLRVRDGRHGAWARSVVTRDQQCMRCGVKDRELHAHHIESYGDNPLLRFDVNNGETLCVDCHAQEHPGLAYLIRTHRTPQFLKTCPMCQRSFKSSQRARIFCSRICASLNTSIEAGGLMTCEGCGIVFLEKPSRRRRSGLKFCSRFCSRKWFGSTQGGRRDGYQKEKELDR